MAMVSQAGLAVKNQLVMSKNITDEDKIRLFLTKNGYDELINHHGINELIRFIEIDLLIPLKAELQKRQTIMNNLRNALDNYLKEV